ncbi:MAG: isoprenylcysteine carboxylmethyltransferase family protein [Longimicrobiales bacterium]|nr:isoprenylcysteine carboxylmethyltransferase family protein [Longimicrobiales bacterium]
METARYLVGVLVVTFLPPGLAWWFVVHPFVGFWRRLGATVTLTLMAVLGVAGVVLLVRVRHLLLGPDLGSHPELWVAAGLLLVMTAWVAYQRKKYLTIRILSGVPELEDDAGELLQEGIYGQIRHPRYVEVVLGTWAYALFANYLGSYVVAALTIPFIHAIVLVEEAELRRRFGERYVEYSRRVPRYLPRFKIPDV